MRNPAPLLQAVPLLGRHPGPTAARARRPLGPLPPPVGSGVHAPLQAVGCRVVVLGEKPHTGLEGWSPGGTGLLPSLGPGQDGPGWVTWQPGLRFLGGRGVSEGIPSEWILQISSSGTSWELGRVLRTHLTVLLPFSQAARDLAWVPQDTSPPRLCVSPQYFALKGGIQPLSPQPAQWQGLQSDQRPWLRGWSD